MGCGNVCVVRCGVGLLWLYVGLVVVLCGGVAAGDVAVWWCGLGGFVVWRGGVWWCCGMLVCVARWCGVVWYGGGVMWAGGVVV